MGKTVLCSIRASVSHTYEWFTLVATPATLKPIAENHPHINKLRSLAHEAQGERGQVSIEVRYLMATLWYYL